MMMKLVNTWSLAFSRRVLPPPNEPNEPMEAKPVRVRLSNPVGDLIAAAAEGGGNLMGEEGAATPLVILLVILAAGVGAVLMGSDDALSSVCEGACGDGDGDGDDRPSAGETGDGTTAAAVEASSAAALAADMSADAVLRAAKSVMPTVMSINIEDMLPYGGNSSMSERNRHTCDSPTGSRCRCC